MATALQLRSCLSACYRSPENLLPKETYVSLEGVNLKKTTEQREGNVWLLLIHMGTHGNRIYWPILSKRW